MPRRPRAPRSPLLPRQPGRRPVPWSLVLTTAVQVVREGRRRWERLLPSEQRELTRILRDARGRPANLTQRDRAELRRLVWKAVGPER